MRILFVLRHPSYLRNFTGVVTALASSGHRLHLLFDYPGPEGEDEIVKRLASEQANITYQFITEERKQIRPPWEWLATRIRYGCDYLRYLEKPFANAHALRARARRKTPEWVSRLGDNYLGRFPPALSIATWLGPALEWSLWEHPLLDRFIKLFKPDLIMVTPVVGLGSYQVDWFKAARRRGIPSALPVTSWDNLTNKGRLRVRPDKILVWNEAQKKEAIEFHGARAREVVVCGSWTYDHWFEWKPSLSRDDFLRIVGLEGAEHYLLYVGSSPFIAPNETKLCARVIEALRANPETAHLGVLIRPHPQNAAQWEGMDLSGFGPGVAIFPRSGCNPLSVSKQNQYFDSLWHSEAVFGINTSAMIEAGVIGRPVFTITDPDFKDTQEGTLHFHHLSDPEAGLLHIAADPAEFARQFAAVLARPADRRAEKSEIFVRSFVRPHGLATAATPRFVATIEEMQGRKARVPRVNQLFGLAIRTLVLRHLTDVRLRSKSRVRLRSVQLPSDEG
jgi:hypothetical protein